MKFWERFWTLRSPGMFELVFGGPLRIYRLTLTRQERDDL